jgi:hypothetical protein
MGMYLCLDLRCRCLEGQGGESPSPMWTKIDATARTIAEDWTSSLGTTAVIGHGKSHI